MTTSRAAQTSPAEPWIPPRETGLTAAEIAEKAGVSESLAYRRAKATGYALGAKVRKAVRRRSTKADPVSHITAYVPEVLVRGFGRRDLAHKPILQLLEESGIALGRARQTVSARQADAQVAAELQVAVGTALLSVRRLVYDVNDKPVQLLHGLYRPDRYEYQMELSQVGGIDARIVAS